EDEMSSGFAMIGACLAGKKAFTTTAGPGNILMQDAFAAAEAMRIPTVAIIMQRGGLSTSTVIYSQEEVTLTCLGGNGEGFRIVYSPSNLQELYNHTIKSFNTAWKYRYPTFVLGDGYLGKMQGEVRLKAMNKNQYVKPEPILLSGKVKNIRNCYDQEEEINEVIEEYREDFTKISPKVAESESYKTADSDILIIAHGIVASAAKVAVDNLRDSGKKVGLWRPITLRPIDTASLFKAVRKKKQVIFVESALGQMASLINNEFGHKKVHKGIRTNIQTVIRTLYRPALGITPEEIIKFIKSK
ncbi:MAG: transketolase C-terminal domain-containing protein, partial [Patescibacteria group bacterium]|nr:transketolase C-terminal domain-containing protein [Patescibacteria group bacterium]